MGNDPRGTSGPRCRVCGYPAEDRDGLLWCTIQDCPLAPLEEGPYDEACPAALHGLVQVVSRAMVLEDTMPAGMGSSAWRHVAVRLEALGTAALSG